MGSAERDRLNDGLSLPQSPTPPYLHQTLSSVTSFSRVMTATGGHNLRHSKEDNPLWTRVGFGDTTCFGCSAPVCLCDIVEIHYSFRRWLGNSVQSLKIDSCCLTAEFSSAFWVAELSLSFFVLLREMLEREQVTHIYFIEIQEINIVSYSHGRNLLAAGLLEKSWTFL